MFPRKLRWASLAVFLGGLALASLQHFFVVNTTSSFPPGIYRKVRRPPQRGELALFCPPDLPIFREALERRFLAPGLCPAGTGQMIKKIQAAPGDHVAISADGVSVNGQTLQGSARRIAMIHSGADLNKKLEAEEVLLMSPNPLSFDARYFGPMSARRLKAALVPVCTWEKQP